MSKIDNLPEKCPICSSKWKETVNFFGETWYDCVKCGKTAEDIIKNSKKSAKKSDSQWNYKGFGNPSDYSSNGKYHGVDHNANPLADLDEDEIEEWLYGLGIFLKIDYRRGSEWKL